MRSLHPCFARNAPNPVIPELIFTRHGCEAEFDIHQRFESGIRIHTRHMYFIHAQNSEAVVYNHAQCLVRVTLTALCWCNHHSGVSNPLPVGTSLANPTQSARADHDAIEHEHNVGAFKGRGYIAPIRNQ